MAKAVFDELGSARPRRHFVVGVTDDVSLSSLDWDPTFAPPRPEGELQAVFFGLGADGTVGANKNSAKIISDGTGANVQGYFVYDSKKSGSMTVSHLRFGPQPIRSTYLITEADFVACHEHGLLERVNVLEWAKPGATFLLNSPASRRPGVGPAAGGGARADRGEARRALGGRRPAHRLRGQPRHPHQHRDAGLLLRPLQGPPRGPGHRRHQGRRWSRPTAGAARRWSIRTSPPSNSALAGLTRVMPPGRGRPDRRRAGRPRLQRRFPVRARGHLAS